MVTETFPVGPLQCNCTIIGDPETGDAIVVDPGGDVDRILERLAHHGLKARACFHTHAHFDHIGGTRGMAERTGSEILLHHGDSELYDNLPLQVARFGFQADAPLPVDHWVTHGDKVVAGRLTGIVLHTPGHTPGSSCLHVPALGLLLAGDTLFRGGVGRTDLWGGSFPQLEASIRTELYALPPETRVVAGHGPGTTIGAERTGNPFVRA